MLALAMNKYFQFIMAQLSFASDGKATGLEGWPILSLKENAQQLSIPLAILFNKSIASSSLPTA